MKFRQLLYPIVVGAGFILTYLFVFYSLTWISRVHPEQGEASYIPFSQYHLLQTDSSFVVLDRETGKFVDVVSKNVTLKTWKISKLR